MTTVLFRRGGDRYTVKFSYDPALVELLKDTVPAWVRSWDPTTKEWTVAAEFGRTLASAIEQAGHRTVGLDESRAAVDRAGWAEALLDAVGPTRHEPVFRALTKVLHPDAPTGRRRRWRRVPGRRGRCRGSTRRRAGRCRGRFGSPIVPGPPHRGHRGGQRHGRPAA